jgi:opacity protein-like surface antigen
MRKIKNSSSRVLALGEAVILFVAILLISSVKVRASPAENGHEGAPGLDLVNPGGSADRSTFKRFQVDLFGSFSTLAPSDLNLLVDHDNKIQEFFFDSYFTHLQGTGEVSSWTKSQEGNRRKIKSAFQLGFRLKYYLNDTLGVSIGLRYLSGKRASDPEFQYTRNETAGDRQIEYLSFSPYSLSAKAFIPLVGVHAMKKMKALLIEGFFSAGPIFAECEYLAEWKYAWRIVGEDYDFDPFETEGILEEKGKGTGLSLDLGGRVQYPLFSGLGVFLEGGYSYQVVKKISGPGREHRGEINDAWDGTWGVLKETVTAPWGTLESEFPTNYWPEASPAAKIRDFALDLSGFQIRLGLSVRL